MSVVGISDIRAAAARIAGSVYRTQVRTSFALNEMAGGGRQLFFKCENFQKTGAFKARGALNAIKCHLEREGPPKMVVTHSSGNHGQAVAWAALQLGLPCTVVVPEGTPAVKCQAIRGYGAQLVFCSPSPTGRKETADRIVEETAGLLVHPYDNVDVIAGQGTIGLELCEQVPELDIILVPVSGGGMASGIALAAKALNPACKVIAVEPEGKNLGACLTAGQRLWPNPPQFLSTIAEGIRTQQVGHLTFPILCSTLHSVVTVTDRQMAEGCRLVAERMKLVVEASSGAAIAAALNPSLLAGVEGGQQRVGVILCGGNVDTDQLPWQVLPPE